MGACLTMWSRDTKGGYTTSKSQEGYKRVKYSLGSVCKLVYTLHSSKPNIFYQIEVTKQENIADVYDIKPVYS